MAHLSCASELRMGMFLHDPSACGLDPISADHARLTVQHCTARAMGRVSIEVYVAYTLVCASL